MDNLTKVMLRLLQMHHKLEFFSLRQYQLVTFQNILEWILQGLPIGKRRQICHANPVKVSK